MNIEQAKKLDMVQFLSKLGYEPADKKGHHYWYHSPLRNEETPSFKINIKMNRWFDWGEGKGGNLVDFGTLYYRCSVAEFLEKLESPVLKAVETLKPSKIITAANAEKEIKVIGVKTLSSFPLLRYLEKRRIPTTLAREYCSEVSYQLNNKNYYAIGFPNNAGGYELRNEYIKAASAPKDITFIDRSAKDVAVFEGFFNFLSYQNLYQNKDEHSRNFLILNSTSFFEKSLSLMQEHNHVHLYLDNDKTGQKFTAQALQLDKEKFKDERSLYQKYDDLNDWVMNFGRPEKHHIVHKL